VFVPGMSSRQKSGERGRPRLLRLSCGVVPAHCRRWRVSHPV
jgi:hypothetical protein